MSDAVPAAFLTRWIALQEENRRLRQQVAEWSMERTALQEEIIRLQAMNDELRRDNAHLRERNAELANRNGERRVGQGVSCPRGCAARRAG
ncbi:hypothetical protein, conserved [Angomonas deanei]|uniref:Uncharacterized protein n=1 Tax=Angomonas deanei TaxID=59799 RepID=A0A7G2BZF2_9TRYP|nr:hypothetical protein, conserved [Angomonas deanei]